MHIPVTGIMLSIFLAMIVVVNGKAIEFNAVSDQHSYVALRYTIII